MVCRALVLVPAVRAPVSVVVARCWPVASVQVRVQVRQVVVAYEPVWAIGTGKVATAADAQEVCAALRAALADKYGQEIADEVRVLYGGSVKSSNIGELIAQSDIDGALVGGASLNGDEFAKLSAIAAGGPLP